MTKYNPEAGGRALAEAERSGATISHTGYVGRPTAYIPSSRKSAAELAQLSRASNRRSRRQKAIAAKLDAVLGSVEEEF